jgi:hypothetical protein
MEKYLYFSKGGGNDAIDDVLCMPVSKFRGFGITTGVTDAVSLTLTFDRLFESLTRDTDNEDFDNVDLIIVSGSIKTVCRAITEAINFGKDPFISVADVENSEFLDANITGVASITIVR